MQGRGRWGGKRKSSGDPFAREGVGALVSTRIFRRLRKQLADKKKGRRVLLRDITVPEDCEELANLNGTFLEGWMSFTIMSAFLPGWRLWIHRNKHGQKSLT
jgi:hypothetical protein